MKGLFMSLHASSKKVRPKPIILSQNKLSVLSKLEQFLISSIVPVFSCLKSKRSKCSILILETGVAQGTILGPLRHTSKALGVYSREISAFESLNILDKLSGTLSSTYPILFRKI